MSNITVVRVTLVGCVTVWAHLSFGDGVHDGDRAERGQVVAAGVVVHLRKFGSRLKTLNSALLATKTKTTPKQLVWQKKKHT